MAMRERHQACGGALQERRPPNCVFQAAASVFLALAAGALRAGDDDAYIESDGTAGIDVGYHVKWNSRVDVDFALTAAVQTNGARLVGADCNNGYLGLAYSLYVSGGYWVYGIGDGREWQTSWPKYVAPAELYGGYIGLDTERHVVSFDFYGDSLVFATGATTNNRTRISSLSKLTDFGNECRHPLSLFAVYANTNATAFHRPSQARIYGVRVYEDDALVHEYTPCVGGGRPGFKDLVDGAFYCNAKSPGAFSAGGAYLVEGACVAMSATDYATEKHYIDTCHVVTAETRVELDYELSALPSGRAYLFSGGGYDDAGENLFCVYVKPNGASFGVTCGGNSIRTRSDATVAGVLGVVRTAVLDYPGNVFKIMSGDKTVYSVSAEAVAGRLFTNNTLKVASYYNGTQYFAPIRVYGLRIYESGEKVRDFAPCWRDGTVGLKDSTTGAFVTYPGTLGTRLAYEGDIACEASPYVETSRALQQYIDTGCVPRGDTRFELDYSLVETRASGDTWYLFGGANGAGFQAYDNSKGYGVYNSAWKQGIVASAAADAAGIRRTAFIDNVSGRGGLVTAGVTNGAVATASGQGSTSSGVPVVLSANNQTNYFASARIYGCRVYEGGTLVHDFRPEVVEGVPGLRDVCAGSPGAFAPVVSKSGSGEHAYGGAFPVSVSPGPVVRCSFGKTVTLVASAPGASGYRWLRDGEPTPGGEDGALAVAWNKALSGASEEYRAVALFSVDGMQAEGEPSEAVSVLHMPPNFMMIIR